jgi:hypothetical protein
MAGTDEAKVIIAPPPLDTKRTRKWYQFASNVRISRLLDAIKIPPFGLAYLDHLIGQYTQSARTIPAADEIVERRKNSAEELTWGDLYSLERVLVANLDAEEVKSSVWAARFRLKQIAGDAAFLEYEKSSVHPDASIEELRADLQRILEFLHWYYCLLPLRNQIRVDYVANCIRWIAVYTVILGVVFVACHIWHLDSATSLAACIIYAGIIGGYVSSMRRLQNVRFDEEDPIVGIYGLKSASYFMWLSPILGATFAMILALLFAGAVVTGAVFPKFTAPEVHNLSEFATTTRPIGSSDYALLLVWSFVAGFAERFVPDNLDKIMATQRNKKNTEGK